MTAVTTSDWNSGCNMIFIPLNTLHEVDCVGALCHSSGILSFKSLNHQCVISVQRTEALVPKFEKSFSFNAIVQYS